MGNPGQRDRIKDLPSLRAGRFSSVCDAMMSHADANYSLYACVPACNVACLGQTRGCAV